MQAKQQHEIRIAAKLSDPNTTSKQYWNLTKMIYGNKIKSSIPSIIEGDTVYATPESKANLFNLHFAAKSTLPDILPELPPFQHLTESRLSEIICTPEEIKKILKNLDTAKANGPDNISNRILKLIADDIATPLANLCNKSFSTSKYPDEWKEANVTPVHKSKHRQSKLNYRPISLLSNLGKVPERIVFIELFRYCIEHKILTWRNAGYKPMDSTVNQLVLLCHRIYEALEQGKDVCFVSLDASSAFDRVWHKGLLFKLKQIGITGKLLLWIEDYLTNRKQRVVIGGKKSAWTAIKAGVPQGSILGPLLFLIYVNDIVNLIECEILLFADDTSLLEAVENPQLSMEKLNRDLQRLCEWATQWLVTFNPSKTRYMIISKKLLPQNYDPLFLDGKQLERAQSHTQLGITFNAKMTWDDHIRNKCTVASKRITVLKRLHNRVPRETKLTIYKSFIRPVLEYGNVLFDNCNAALSEMLENVQREAALAITGAYLKTSHNKLLHELGLDLLSNRRSKAKVVLLFKIKHDLTASYLKDLLPKQLGECVSYNMRNANNIREPKTSKNYFLKSFLPSSIKLWNNIDIGIRNMTELENFRNSVTHLYTPAVLYMPYLHGNSKSYIQISRMRMGLSGLNAHRKSYHFIDHCTCDKCNARQEDCKHYLLECPAYAAHRLEMIALLTDLIPHDQESILNLRIVKNRKNLCKILIFGLGNPEKDKNIFDVVANFIQQSQRFL